MAGLKGYIIRLEDFDDSQSWSQHAFNTGIKNSWSLEFFNGVNGRLTNLDQYQLRIYDVLDLANPYLPDNGGKVLERMPSLPRVPRRLSAGSMLMALCLLIGCCAMV